MRIPLLTSLGQPEMDYLNNVVTLKTPRKISRSSFILDTGSPITILGYSDALILQINFNNLSKREIIKLGGRKYQGYVFNKLTFFFKSEDNKLVSEKFPVIAIKPTSDKEKREIGTAPTIIGTDFLKNKKYKLFCDMAGKVAYLEK